MSLYIDPNIETNEFEVDAILADAARRPSVVVLNGPREGQAFPLVGSTTVLGRSSEADIQFLRDGVSRKHAAFMVSADQCVVQDLESKNGTFVNGERGDYFTLQEGDEISLGGRVIVKFSRTSPVEEDFLRRQFESVTRDALTGLHNRRELEAQGRIEFAFAKRHQRPLSAAMIDIDYFKRINDTLGHTQGDEVLRLVARAIENTLRAEDFTARYGGEEFLVLMRETDTDAAYLAAERIRQAVLNIEHTMPFELSCSVGVATLSERNKDVISLYECADIALYEAKNNGRNRVGFFKSKSITTKVDKPIFVKA